MIDFPFKWTVRGCPPSMKNDLDGGHHHKDGLVAKYELDFAKQTPARFKLGLAGPIRVRLVIVKKNGRQDGVNMDDVVWDSLQAAGVIKNDRQIIDWACTSFIDPSDPRVLIELEAMK